MKIVIKEKVIPYILISLFSSIGLSAYGYKAEGQGGSKAVVWSISKIDTMQKNVPVSYTHLTLPTSDLV